MAGRDFSQFGLQKIPAAMFTKGSMSQERMDQYKAKGQIPGLHIGVFYPDPEATLATALKANVTMALGLFKQVPKIDYQQGH